MCGLRSKRVILQLLLNVKQFKRRNLKQLKIVSPCNYKAIFCDRLIFAINHEVKSYKAHIGFEKIHQKELESLFIDKERQEKS